MKIILIIQFIIIAILAYQTFKYWLTSAVFSAWIAKSKYAPPTDEEVKSLTKWAMHHMFKTKIK